MYQNIDSTDQPPVIFQVSGSGVVTGMFVDNSHLNQVHQETKTRLEEAQVELGNTQFALNAAEQNRQRLITKNRELSAMYGTTKFRKNSLREKLIASEYKSEQEKSDLINQLSQATQKESWLQESLDKNLKETSDLQQKIVQFEHHISIQEGTIIAIEEKLSSTEQKLSTVQLQATYLDSAVEERETTINTLISKQCQSEKNKEQMMQEYQELLRLKELEINSLREKIASLKNDIEQLNKQQANERQDLLQKTQQQEEIISIISTNLTNIEKDHATKVIGYENDMQALREALEEKHQQIKSINCEHAQEEYKSFIKQKELQAEIAKINIHLQSITAFCIAQGYAPEVLKKITETAVAEQRSNSSEFNQQIKLKEINDQFNEYQQSMDSFDKNGSSIVQDMHTLYQVAFEYYTQCVDIKDEHILIKLHLNFIIFIRKFSILMNSLQISAEEQRFVTTIMRKADEICDALIALHSIKKLDIYEEYFTSKIITLEAQASISFSAHDKQSYLEQRDLLIKEQRASEQAQAHSVANLVKCEQKCQQAVANVEYITKEIAPKSSRSVSQEKKDEDLYHLVKALSEKVDAEKQPGIEKKSFFLEKPKEELCVFSDPVITLLNSTIKSIKTTKIVDIFAEENITFISLLAQYFMRHFKNGYHFDYQGNIFIKTHQQLKSSLYDLKLLHAKKDCFTLNTRCLETYVNCCDILINYTKHFINHEPTMNQREVLSIIIQFIKQPCMYPQAISFLEAAKSVFNPFLYTEGERNNRYNTSFQFMQKKIKAYMREYPNTILTQTFLINAHTGAHSQLAKPEIKFPDSASSTIETTTAPDESSSFTDTISSAASTTEKAPELSRGVAKKESKDKKKKSAATCKP